MGNRMKEDDRIEKIIRGLIKLPENRRCINCNSLGPQYVCTTFLTFVCTNCSGVHREFSHRVKSVSVSKFSMEEVNALQAGGNERARQIYFRAWDSRRHALPDSSSLYGLREFIKHAYVDRKYTGERSSELPRLRLGGKEEFNESRRYCSGSRSSYDEKMYERYYTERFSPRGKNDVIHSNYYYDEIRSPRYPKENFRHESHKQSPVRFEVVDDRVRNDRFGNRRFAPGGSKLQSRLPNTNKSVDSSCSPVARPVQELLGDNVPTLQVGVISKENQESIDQKVVEHQKENLQSLIDFGTETETETQDAASISRTQKMSSFNNSNSSVSAASSAQQMSSQAAKVNTLESLLFGLLVPEDEVSEAPGSDVLATAPGDNMLAAGVTLPAPMQQMPELSVANVPKRPSIDNLLEATSSSGTIVEEHQPPPSLAQGSGFMSQKTALPIEFLNNESTVSSLAHSAQASSSIFDGPSSQSVSRTVQDTRVGVESKPLPVEAKSSTRMELPADLFTISYSSMATPVSSWQTGPPHGMGFNYYPNAMHVPAFPNPTKSINPFDTNDERSQFPSVGSFQAAPGSVLPAPTGIIHGFSLGPYSSQLQTPSFGSASSPYAYTGQKVHNNVQPRPQGIGGFESNGAISGGINTCQQPTGEYPAPATPGGNPFE